MIELTRRAALGGIVAGCAVASFGGIDLADTNRELVSPLSPLFPIIRGDHAMLVRKAMVVETVQPQRTPWEIARYYSGIGDMPAARPVPVGEVVPRVLARFSNCHGTREKSVEEAETA